MHEPPSDTNWTRQFKYRRPSRIVQCRVCKWSSVQPLILAGVTLSPPWTMPTNQSDASSPVQTLYCAILLLWLLDLNEPKGPAEYFCLIWIRPRSHCKQTAIDPSLILKNFLTSCILDNILSIIVDFFTTNHLIRDHSQMTSAKFSDCSHSTVTVGGEFCNNS